jgi:putative hydrolase of the HAD superfamily
VVFDLFHTLTRRESEWWGAPFTSDLLGLDRREWDRVLHSSRWRLAGQERDPFTIVRRLTDLIDTSIPDETIHRAVDARLRRFRGALDAIPSENVATLRVLREEGFRLGLVSNADPTELFAWSSCVLCGAFDAEVFSCDVGWVKPEPEIFNACLDKLELSAEECVFVGDGGSGELVAAKELGFHTVFVSGVIAELWPERIQERIAIADHHIERLPEIERLVKQIVLAK